MFVAKSFKFNFKQIIRENNFEFGLIMHFYF